MGRDGGKAVVGGAGGRDGGGEGKFPEDSVVQDPKARLEGAGDANWTAITAGREGSQVDTQTSQLLY